MSKKDEYTIGQLAKSVDVNVQTLRFYERKGLLKPARRLESTYRIYDSDGLKRIQFIRKAKSMGFSLSEIQELLKLRVNTRERCENVRAKAANKLKEVRERITSLQKLESTLLELIADCKKRVVNNSCPIIEKMEGL